MTTIALQAVGLGKKFSFTRRNKTTLGKTLFAVFQRKTVQEFWAVKDVSFSITRGESVAVVGHNGAGKSTLMNMLGGIYLPSAGVISASGTVGLLEIGIGFHPDLTGRENILLNASLRGLSRKQVMKRFDAIVEFSEMENFLDTPVRSYSTGMSARIAFSIAIQMNPEILIVDEVLAVGDFNFQNKCKAWIDDFRRSGRTLILVSHVLEKVKLICERVLWMDKGTLRMDGSADDVIKAYKEDQEKSGTLWHAELSQKERQALI